MTLKLQHINGLMRRREIARMPVIYHPLTSVLTTLPTGQAVSFVGSGYAAATVGGIDCVTFPTNVTNYFQIPYPRFFNTLEFSVSFWMKKDCPASSKSISMFSFGNNYTNNTYTYMRWFISKRSQNSSRTIIGIYDSGVADSYVMLQNADSAWHHIAVVGRIWRHGTNRGAMSLDLYVDGLKQDTLEHLSTYGKSNWTEVDIGAFNGSETGTLSYAALRVWDRNLSAAEITDLAHEFTPTP